MAKVNWNKAVAAAVVKAKSRGHEANVTQARNVVNDLARHLVECHTAGEIIDAIYLLATSATFKK